LMVYPDMQIRHVLFVIAICSSDTHERILFRPLILACLAGESDHLR
jgi:hypothetical protein